MTYKWGDKMSKFSINVKKLRKRAKLSQAELAEKVGVSQVSVCMYELETAMPNPATLVRLARALGVTVEELVEVGYDE